MAKVIHLPYNNIFSLGTLSVSLQLNDLPSSYFSLENFEWECHFYGSHQVKAFQRLLLFFVVQCAFPKSHVISTILDIDFDSGYTPVHG